MTDRLVRPDWVRRINLMAGSVGGHPRDLVPIDAGDLLGTATAALGGLPDGDLGDPRWQERFEALAIAIDATDMHVVGRLTTKQELLRSLRARLLLTAAIDAAPAITQRPVTAPVIVTGPARSGTTILFELLALDPELRAPTAAEALHPVALPEAANNPALPEPVVLSECEQEFWADVQPEFQALHELRSDLPVECVTLTQGSFCGFHWSMIASLDVWLPDPAVNYAYERQFLQALQHGTEQTEQTLQWVLKTPGHLMLLPLLYAEFGDAWVVQTHRDPAKTMPSTVSTTAMIQWLRTDDVDVDGLAEIILAVFADGLNGSIDVRASGMVPGDRFVDVHFAELMSDPTGTLRAAYAKMGRDFTDDHAAAVLDYLANKPKGKFGVHRYQPEDWGFTAESLRAALAPYIAHYGVVSE
ncbi:MAG: sulfotransferase [Acidimicrobiaceae bacterium]|nr:sulfotransferase [Acidimicrobiaceae bacterium]